MKISVEMSVIENGTVVESRGYLRDSEIELKDLLDWTKSKLILLSDIALREEQAKGFDKQPVMLVDNRRTKNIEDVSPLGKIEFVARQQFGDILFDTYAALLDLSKVLTGLYKASHYVFHNGEQIAGSMRELEAWIAFKGTEVKDGDVFRIVNIQPYARRLELLGVTSTRQQARRDDPGRRKGKKTGTTIKIPNGAYQLTSRRIRSKYKQNAMIRFQFVPGGSIGLSGSFKSGRKKNSAGRPYLYPSISITVQERGIL